MRCRLQGDKPRFLPSAGPPLPRGSRVSEVISARVASQSALPWPAVCGAQPRPPTRPPSALLPAATAKGTRAPEGPSRGLSGFGRTDGSTVSAGMERKGS